MSWICPDCGLSNSDQLVRCVCGYEGTEENEFEGVSVGNSASAKTDGKACPSCGKEVPAEDKFCSYCGKSTSVLSEKEKKEIKKASKWILIISILFVVFGTVQGFVQKSVAEKARANLAKFEDSHIWETPINGKKYTVGELRNQIDKEVILVFLTNYFLASIMFALFLWASRAPFPAMLTALCVYLAIMALNGILDPKTLFQGIIIKAIFVGALIAGIKASLVARNIAQA